MPRHKKEYIFKLLESKSPSYIKDNFNYVVEMFEREDEDREVIAEHVKESYSKPKRSRRPRSSRYESRGIEVDTPPVVMTESVKPSSVASEYLLELQNQENR